MNHTEFLAKYRGTFQKEPWMTTAECVALVKLYNEEVYGMRPWYFGWSALAGWNLNTAFNFQKYKRVLYTGKEVPPIWSTVFFDERYGRYGHVAITHMSGWPAQFTILEQNWSGKPWDTEDDKIRIRHVGFLWLLGWYELIDSEEAKEVERRNKRYMKLLWISDNNLYEPITKWDMITINSLEFENVTNKLKDMERRIKKLERK